MRVVVLGICCVAISIGTVVLLKGTPRTTPFPARPGPGQFVVDDAGVINPASLTRLNALLGAVLRDTDIALMVVSVDSLGNRSIQAFTNTLFERWKIGSQTKANRGVLFVLSKHDKQVRFEVAYGLEGIFPDAFVSYVEHRQMVPYFASNYIGEGIEATIELIAGRAFEKVLNRSYDPKQAGAANIGGFYSGGAGAQATVPLGEKKAAGSNNRTIETKHRAYFSAQPSPHLAWERFLEVNQRTIQDAELDLFDEKSKALLRRRPYTQAARAHIAKLYAGKTPTIRQRGKLAAVLFLNDPNHLLAPWFFHRTAKGWQLDGNMYPDVISYNHRNQWRLKRRDIPYLFAFHDYRLDRNGFAFHRVSTR